MNKILLSACLLGDPVRYDGQSKTQRNAALDKLLSQHRVISFCPEVAGGLPVPRAAAEIHAGDGAAVLAKLASVKTKEPMLANFSCQVHGRRSRYVVNTISGSLY